MRPDTLLAVAVFGALGGALWLLLVAVLAPAPAAPRLAGRIRAALARPRVGIAAAVGVLTAVLTRWPVAVLAAAALVWSWPRIVGRGASAQGAIDRLEALAGWTESLKDTIAGAIGLEEAIPATAVAAGDPIRPQVERLVSRLHARTPLPEALGDFADDLGDPSADLVVAALILNAQLRGPGLRSTLEALATSARDELDLRRRIESGRRALRTGVRIIIGVTAGFVAAMAALDSAYLDPYDTLTGQVVLVAVVAIFAGAFTWLHRLAADTHADRLLTRHPHAPGARPASLGGAR